MSVQQDALYELRDIARECSKALSDMTNDIRDDYHTLYHCVDCIKFMAEEAYIAGSLELEWHRNRDEVINELY